MNPEIARALQWLDEGVMTRAGAFIHVAVELANTGTADDVVGLPDWLKERLRVWAAEFDQEGRWLLVSNAGERDVTHEGKKLRGVIRVCEVKGYL